MSFSRVVLFFPSEFCLYLPPLHLCALGRLGLGGGWGSLLPLVLKREAEVTFFIFF